MRIPYLLTLLFLFPALCSAAVMLEVSVQGLDSELEENVLFYLDIVKQKDSERLSVHRMKRLNEKSPAQIREALQPFGYYNPEISTSLQEVDGKWKALYTVSKGVPTLLSQVQIHWQGAGAGDPELAKSVRDFPLKQGDQLNHTVYEAGKKMLLDAAYAIGYAKANTLESTVEVDLDDNSATVTITIDTGPLYFFGEVGFEQDFLDPDLLEQYNTLEVGSPYLLDNLLTFQQNLIASGYTREVTIHPDFDRATDDRVPLHVLMKPVIPHKLSFGIGYESDIGPRMPVRWTDRLINRFGHHSEVSMKLAEKERSLIGSYSIPVVEPLTDRWVNTLSYEYEETPSTISDTFEYETAFVRRNLEDTRFKKIFALFSLEEFTINGEEAEQTRLFSVGGTSRFSDMDEDLFPQHGYFASADLRGASNMVLSDISFSRLHTNGRYLLGLGENGRLDARAELGVTWVDDFDRYPTSLRFFAGGNSSIRGYKWQSLGPEDDKNVVVGGRNIVVASLEYDHRVAEKWVVDGFVDAGNAFNETLDTIYVGAGIGFRWLAPFGSLRVDLAWPVSENPEFSDIRLHLAFGATL